MSQEEEKKQDSATRSVGIGGAHLDVQKRVPVTLPSICPLMLLDREGREIGNIWVCFLGGFFFLTE